MKSSPIQTRIEKKKKKFCKTQQTISALLKSKLVRQ